jgi:hypothetical protein
MAPRDEISPQRFDGPRDLIFMKAWLTISPLPLTMTAHGF